MNNAIPFTEFGGNGPHLHFMHANGYPPACYLPLIEHLKSNFNVFGMHLRPLWPNANPKDLRDWTPLSQDLLRFLSNPERGPVLGVGHSIGGIVTLRAALKEPSRFRGIVLIDPVLFPPYFIASWNLARLTGLGWKVHPKIASALSRRRHFDDLDRVFRGYRRRDVFRNMSDENLRAYIQGIARPREGGGYELVFSPEWEAQIYYTGIWRDLDMWRKLKQLQTPTLILRGAQSDTFWAKTAARVHRAQPKVQIETLENTTHILPLESPDRVSRFIVEFARQIQ